jgi:hypothetical protein
MLKNQTHRFIIGIDPGTKTGVAIWDRKIKTFVLIDTLCIVDAILDIGNFVRHQEEIGEKVMIRCENPNTWRPFKGRNDKATNSRLQGAGSVKRDFAIWKEFAELFDVFFEPVSLQAAQKKMDAATFKKITGINQRTSNHARDAAMLVYNKF